MQRCNAEIDWNCKLIWGRLNTLCFRFSFAFALAFFRFVSFSFCIYSDCCCCCCCCRCCRRNSARYWALQVRTKHADNNNNSNSNMRERQLRWLRRRRRQLIGNWAHETCCVGNNNSSNTTTTTTWATFAQCICQSVAVVVFWILYLINCSGNLQIQLADTDRKAQLQIQIQLRTSCEVLPIYLQIFIWLFSQLVYIEQAKRERAHCSYATLAAKIGKVLGSFVAVVAFYYCSVVVVADDLVASDSHASPAYLWGSRKQLTICRGLRIVRVLMESLSLSR